MEGQQMPPQTPPSPQGAPMPQPPMNEQDDINQNKIWALLSYLWILVLIPLLIKKDSRFVQFHAKQGLVMLIAWFFVTIPLLGLLIWLALVVFWFIAVIKVLEGQYWKMPVIGDFAEKIKI